MRDTRAGASLLPNSVAMGALEHQQVIIKSIYAWTTFFAGLVFSISKLASAILPQQVDLIRLWLMAV